MMRHNDQEAVYKVMHVPSTSDMLYMLEHELAADTQLFVHMFSPSILTVKRYQHIFAKHPFNAFAFNTNSPSCEQLHYLYKEIAFKINVHELSDGNFFSRIFAHNSPHLVLILDGCSSYPLSLKTKPPEVPCTTFIVTNKILH